jgi:signal transduction histidine kinase/DNA-binding response OmpR family regulator/HPt (histidine-containing phosphotransfer) domain-containing protein
LLGAPYLQSAFEGTTVLSTTREEHDGALSIHVCSKISDDLVLSATIDGLYFQNHLEDFEIWDSGYVFLIDENGTHISCNDPDCVENRENFHIMLGNGYEYLDTGEILHDIQTIGTGVKEYRLKGEDMVIAFKNVTSSASGWSVGVIAPLDESSLRDTNTGMLVAGLVSLILAVFAGVIASRVIEKPYIEAWEAERRSEEANESKSAFLANVSHEMRTPLNAIIGLTELCLSSEKMEPAVENYCEKTHTAGVTLLGIINDILDLSKMEAGKLEIIAVDYDTPSLINDTVTINMVRIGSKPIEFKLRVDENLPSRLHGDDLRVKQMFNNLLSNAFKYTEKGEVVMDISGEMKEDGYWLEVSVADSGIGIKPENISKLFCNYNQVDTKANRKIEGTGLGLALTKQLVELMDGSVTVTSEYGVGSTFTVRFRQDVINAAAIGKDVVTQLQSLRFVEEKRSRGARFIRAHLPYARVLIVDDVAVNLDVARGLMKPYQMQIDCVKSGIEAIELIRAGKPRYDAIFMDHMMPEMDGVEATKIIREQIDSDYARTIPIIALTANAIVGNEEMFLSSGFQAFLSKPIDTTRLDAVINQYVRNRTKEKEYALRKAEGTLERREGTDRRENSDRRQNSDRRSGIDRRVVEGWSVVGVNITKGIKRYDDDIEAYYDVVESYINNTPELMEKLGSHLDANSLADYGIIVHGVKGSSRAICADAVGDLAEELEFGAKAGDEALVREKHPVLVEQISKLLEGLKEAFAEYGPQTNLPTREKPDPLALDALLEAAKSFDIDAVDAAMHEIDSYTYSNDQGLVAWLHEQLKVMGFKNIVERLSGGD